MKNGWLWWYWPFALAFIALVLFAIPEAIALKVGGPTFSEFMATVAYDGSFGKLWIFLWGFLIGALVVHFVGWAATPAKTEG